MYFSTTGIVALLYLLENGASAEFAVVDNEGIVGVFLFMGGNSTPSQAVVQSAGRGFRLPAKVLVEAFERGGPVARLIASMLGVRREGVTDPAVALQKAGLIKYSRGHITVVDRPALESRTCECCAVVKQEYDRLLPDKQAT